MKKIVFLLLLASISCNESPVPKPDKLLDEDIMVDILYDTALLQAAEAYLPNRLTENQIRIKNYIYLKYSIDSATYYQNQLYYASDFKKYKRMYKKVTERIVEEKTEIDTLVAEEIRNKPEKPPLERKKITGNNLKDNKDTLSY
ncbi:DUF4296 domain-containing protein [Flavobacterium jejuense]|uniref:DUF4296 domain-containing protein n=1 Tax=Flavobacterium jejuense TaxID=1544455 RepID=A0ABX0ITJ1_9FLAO|nr:DUF4296 domain-containing protein [Flavobacterium jejuense]NHN27023.1 DUF4296 domain-containing protein [Flavobacterium jejuense]